MTAYSPAPAVPFTPHDPTNVMGRRISAWLIDVMLFSIIGIGLGASMWFNSADHYKDVGTEFCDAINGTGDFGPLITEEELRLNDVRGEESRQLVRERINDTCFQINEDAYVAEDEDTGAAIGVAALIGFGIPFLNLLLLQGLTGASLGKHMLGLRVVRGDGQVAHFGWNALRTLLLIVDMAPICFPLGALVGLVTSLASKGHRRVGDMAAGTYVVRKSSVGTPIEQPTQTPWSAPPPNAGLPGTYAQPATPTSPPHTPPQQAPTPPLVPPTGGGPTYAPPSYAPPTSPPTAPPAAPPAQPPAGQSGWAAPQAEAPEAPAGEVAVPPAPPAPEPPAAAAPVDETPNATNAQWDDRWGAWMRREPTTRQWQRWDDTTRAWVDIE